MLLQKIRNLTDEEFDETFSAPMKDVTQAAGEIVEVWPYLDSVFKKEFSEAETHQHILVNTRMENVYLVVVVDIGSREISGLYLLNLNEKYGLSH